MTTTRSCRVLCELKYFLVSLVALPEDLKSPPTFTSGFLGLGWRVDSRKPVLYSLAFRVFKRARSDASRPLHPEL